MRKIYYWQDGRRFYYSFVPQRPHEFVLWRDASKPVPDGDVVAAEAAEQEFVQWVTDSDHEAERVILDEAEEVTDEE